MYEYRRRHAAGEELSHLAGWNGVRPVVIGNVAEAQDQHDIYGELLRALCIFLDASYPEI